jgi:inhibitor of KinA sporulation pathway (predicted exonuclease)
MTYIIFDLEFNQANNKIGENSNSQCPFEIIQIGAYKLNSDLKEIGTFDRLVKPSLYEQIHPFIKELTNINQSQLDDASPFSDVLKAFTTFIGDTDTIFGVWGMGDIKELYKNILYHNLQDQFVLNQYINIQKYTSLHFHLPKGKYIGLRNAVDFLNIPLSKSLHDAFNDAYYTKEIFKKLEMHQVKPTFYDPTQFNTMETIRPPKKKTDIHGLLQQFEKMYERKLTEEEKSMIILSYKMGLTQQFQILDK